MPVTLNSNNPLPKGLECGIPKLFPCFFSNWRVLSVLDLKSISNDSKNFSDFLLKKIICIFIFYQTSDVG